MAEELTPVYQGRGKVEAVKNGLDALVQSGHVRQSEEHYYFKLRRCTDTGGWRRDASCRVQCVNGGLQIGIMGSLKGDPEGTRSLMEVLTEKIGNVLLVAGEGGFSYHGKRFPIVTSETYYEVEPLRPAQYHTDKLIAGLPKMQRPLVQIESLKRRRPGTLRLNLKDLKRSPGVEVCNGKVFKAVVDGDGETGVSVLCANEYGVYWVRTDDYPPEVTNNPKMPFGVKPGDDPGWTYEYQPGERNGFNGSGKDREERRTREAIAASGLSESSFLSFPGRSPNSLVNRRRGSGGTRGRHKGRGKVPGGKRRF